MILEHFIKDLLTYFLPASIALTITIIAIQRLRTKKIILWTNISLFIFVILCSIPTIPPRKPLTVEFAFFSFTRDFAQVYDLNSDSQKRPPEFLGVKQVPDPVNLPVVHSDESASMKVKLNQKAYVYILHADILSGKSSFLFPSKKTYTHKRFNPDVWLEFPHEKTRWDFDDKTGIEIFIAYISRHKSYNIKQKINSLLKKAKQSSKETEKILQNIQSGLEKIAPYNRGDFEVEMQIETKVKTRKYQSEKGKALLLCKFVRHEV